MRMFLLALSLVLTAAAPSGWGDLSGWVGRYPTDNGRHLLGTPPIRAGLQQVLSPADQAKLRSFTNEAPVEQSGAYLLIKQCMPHDCGNQNAMIVLDTTTQHMWVGMFSRGSRTTAVRWFGMTDPSDLGPEIMQTFDAQHRPQ